MYAEPLLKDGQVSNQMLVASDLLNLSPDLRRMLKVQWKEFIHWLEENDNGATTAPARFFIFL